jgi:hypothetical protein
VLWVGRLLCGLVVKGGVVKAIHAGVYKRLVIISIEKVLVGLVSTKRLAISLKFRHRK